MIESNREDIVAELRRAAGPRPVLRVRSAAPGFAVVAGDAPLGLGQRLEFPSLGAVGEVVGVDGDGAKVMLSGPCAGLRVGDLSLPVEGPAFAPGDGWFGRILDPDGVPRDGLPPPAAEERAPWRPSGGFGLPLTTGLSVLDAILPLCRGQRIGLFAGSGVGKSTLIGSLAAGVRADAVVVSLVGERRRELEEFAERLSPEERARTVIVAATSDEGPSARRSCARAGMDVATALAGRGHDVLFLCDSVTRIAEAEREIAVATGEPLGPGGHAPWTPRRLAELVERAGSGARGSGSVTAIFSVLVPGSDMEDPIADAMRGLLDGHVILDREIAERGRFPAIDVLRSVSRSAPACLPEGGAEAVTDLRRILSARSEAEMMLRAGLYIEGSDPLIDRAIALEDGIEGFLSSPSTSPSEATTRLSDLLSG